MANEQAQTGFLTRDCVIKAGRHGKRGDKIEKDAVGDQVWTDLAQAGALSVEKPKPKPEGK